MAPKARFRHVGLAAVLGAVALALVVAGRRAVLAPTVAPAVKAPADYSVLLIVIDALRADHLGCYGYHRNTSPFIDSIAAQGVVFERAMSASSFTCESVSSIFTGVLPSCSDTGAGWCAKPSPGTQNMAELFSAAGYVTGLFTNQPALYDPAFDTGFAETDHIEEKWGISGQGPRLTQRVLEFLAKHRDRKTMAYVHYLDPHSPYDPPEARYLQFADEVFPGGLRLYKDVRPAIPELVAEGFGPGEARFDDLVLRYDAEIADTDAALGALVEGMKGLGVLDHTLVIITADHGEEFLDHGYVEHAWRLYNESIHVPLVFWAPGVLEPARIADHVSLIDLLPTLLGFAGLGNPRDEPEGASLFRGDGGALTYEPAARPVIAELLLETRSNLRVVMQDNHKYMAATRWYTPAECAAAARRQSRELALLKAGRSARLPDIYGPTVHEEYYDLEADPGEKEPLTTLGAPKRDALKAILDALTAANAGKAQLGQCGPLTPELREQLRSLGYGDAEPDPPQPSPAHQHDEQMKALGYL